MAWIKNFESHIKWKKKMPNVIYDIRRWIQSSRVSSKIPERIECNCSVGNKSCVGKNARKIISVFHMKIPNAAPSSKIRKMLKQNSMNPDFLLRGRNIFIESLGNFFAQFLAHQVWEVFPNKIDFSFFKVCQKCNLKAIRRLRECERRNQKADPRILGLPFTFEDK